MDQRHREETGGMFTSLQLPSTNRVAFPHQRQSCPCHFLCQTRFANTEHVWKELWSHIVRELSSAPFSLAVIVGVTYLVNSVKNLSKFRFCTCETEFAIATLFYSYWKGRWSSRAGKEVQWPLPGIRKISWVLLHINWVAHSNSAISTILHLKKPKHKYQSKF